MGILSQIAPHGFAILVFDTLPDKLNNHNQVLARTQEGRSEIASSFLV
jgi:hypothetical protein